MPELSKLEKDVADALANAGIFTTRQGMTRIYEAPKTKLLTGVPVFAVGTWTDSSGQTREWTAADLQAMVDAFNAGVPPVVSLKAGHTSDAFNQTVAEALGIPTDLVTGELGSGQISLGRMTSLQLQGGMLIASFEKVPDAVASLIEGGQFDTVSSEIEEQVGDFSPVLTGVALLGAERPAVDSAKLDRSQVFTAQVFGEHRNGATVFTFSKSDFGFEGLTEDTDGEDGTTANEEDGNEAAWHEKLSRLGEQIRQIFGRNSELEDTGGHNAGTTNNNTGGEFMDELKAIASALGIEENATLEDCVGAIAALKEANAAAAESAGNMEEAAGQFKAVNAEIDALKETNATLIFDKRKSEYKELTGQLTAIDGTPDELATELATIERDINKDAADRMFTNYFNANEAAKAAQAVTGHEKREFKSNANGHPFEVQVNKYAEENGKTFQVALAHFARTDPAGFAEYLRASRED